MTQQEAPNRPEPQAFPKWLTVLLVLLVILLSFLSGCTSTRAITAEQRTFLPLSLDFIGEYQLPKQDFQGTPVGGLSGLTYDGRRDRVYALSDDRSQRAPARFYTLKLALQETETGETVLDEVAIEDVTFLKDENGNTYPEGSLDPEGIALSPKDTLFISSEGIPSQDVAPFIQEFDRTNGEYQQNVRLPDRYLPMTQTSGEEEPLPRGIRDNLGFESLSLEPTSLAAGSGDPFRLFTATESDLFQDRLPPDSPEQTRIRLLHYLIGDIAPPMLVAEHLYLLEPAPEGAIDNGLTDLIAVDTGGHFLSLEHTYSPSGNGAKIYQLAMSAALDTSGIGTLKGNISRIEPIKKKLMLDLSDLDIDLDNLEGMTLGPRLPDGSPSLLLVSDDNFSNTQVTQFLLFRLSDRS
jgi:hypothetical protein